MLTRASASLLEQHVGLFLFLQVLVEQPDRIRHAQLAGPGLERAVAGDLVMFDRLRGGKDARIQRRAVGELLHDLLALVDDAVDRLAGNSARRLSDILKTCSSRSIWPSV